MTKEELQSETITFLRFPLIVGVIFIHSLLTRVVLDGENVLLDEHFPLYSNISYFLSCILARIAVPLFFFISGFLFFYKIKEWSVPVYVRTIKKRGRTLFVPYLFWNLATLFIFFFQQSLFPEFGSGANKLIADYSCSDWLWAFWNTGEINPGSVGGMPICGPMWFMRDLMVVMLFSPLVYWGMKKMKGIFVFLLFCLWIGNCWLDVYGLNITAFFFFSAGAYFSISNQTFIDKVQSVYPYSLGLYLLFSIVLLFYKNENGWVDYFMRVNDVLGIMGVLALSSLNIAKSRWKTSSLLSESSFFVFAYHIMPLGFLIRFGLKLFPPQTDVGALFLYFSNPIIISLLGVLLYFGLKRFFPRITAVITGGR